MKANHTYSIWYGMTGQLVEFTVLRESPHEHCVLMYDVDSRECLYLTRETFAQILRTARGDRSISVARG